MNELLSEYHRTAADITIRGSGLYGGGLSLLATMHN